MSMAALELVHNMKKLSPRAAFIANTDLKKLTGYAWDTMQLASNHDPDICRWLTALIRRVDVLERQMERIGASQYRTIYEGKTRAKHS
jgi:hypothetical protein